MENKAHALIAGVFTLVLLIAAVLLAMWFNRDRVVRVPYEMVTTLSIPGLSPQADVRYRGLDVGKVDDIIFDPKVPGQILVHFSVRPDTPMTRSTYGVLGYQGVTGIAYVQLDDDGTSAVRLPSSKEHVARIEMRPSLFDNLQTRGLAILKQTEELTLRMNRLMTPENQTQILDAFGNISKAAIAIETIPRQLEPALAKIPALTRQADRTLQSVSTLAGNINNLTSQLQAPDGTVDRLALTLDQLGAAANKIELEVVPLASDVRGTMRTLNRTLESLNARPQSLLFGAGTAAPGPGETGFVAPSH